MDNKQIGLTDARRQMGELIGLVIGGKHVELTNYGYPIAVIVSINDYRKLTADQDNDA